MRLKKIDIKNECMPLLHHFMSVLNKVLVKDHAKCISYWRAIVCLDLRARLNSCDVMLL